MDKCFSHVNFILFQRILLCGKGVYVACIPFEWVTKMETWIVLLWKAAEFPLGQLENDVSVEVRLLLLLGGIAQCCIYRGSC